MPVSMIRTGSACVPDQRNNGVSIERVENLSIVSLKVAAKSLDDASNRLQLASSMTAAGNDPQSLWLGPDRWLLVSNSIAPQVIVRDCNEALVGILHNAVDYSAGLEMLRIAGPDARQLLAAGSGIDLRPGKFPIRSCCRTRLAQIAAVIVAEEPKRFDIYVDRSYGTYMQDWLTDSSGIMLHL